MIRSLVLALAYCGMIFGILLVAFGIIRFFHGVIDGEISLPGFKANKSRPVSPETMNYLDFGVYYEDFSEFLFRLVKLNYKKLGVRCPENPHDLFLDQFEQRILRYNGAYIFTYTIPREEKLYIGGGKKLEKTYPDEKFVAQLVKFELHKYMGAEYTVSGPIQVISGENAIRLRICGVRFLPCGGAS